MKQRVSRILLLALICLFTLGAGQALAVPAAPKVHDLKQPDGTSFKARQWGDEWQSGWETQEGYTIVHDKATGHWSYPDQDDSGNLIPSTRHVGKHIPGAGDKKHLRPHGDADKKKSHSGATQSAPAATASGVIAGDAGVPALPAEAPLQTGTVNIPTIMVNFSDTTTTYSKQNFADLLYSTGTWSLKDFYLGASNNQYTITPGPAGVIGWVTAPNSHDYYGADGLNGFGNAAKDVHVGDLVWDAVAKANETVDFSAYDNDGDCVVDVVMIAHQGNGQETTGNTNDIWSKSWSLQGASYYGQSSHPYTAPNYGAYVTKDVCKADPSKFVTINKFVIQPETDGANMTTVGVYVHEYGHFLGLPDLYDTDYTSAGAGDWTVMAGGSWNGVTLSGDRPAQLDAWSRYFLGWVTPTKLTGSVSGKTFQAVESSNDIYQFLNGSAPGVTGEYFLAENRQLTGFDAALPGAGLLLWHVDEAKTNNTQEWYPGCVTCTGHYKVALIQADGLYSMEKDSNSRGDSGDPFKGGGGNRTIGHTTFPANDLYSGAASGFALACVSPSALTMSADIYFGSLPNSTLTITKAGTGTGTVTGSAGGLSCGATCSASFPVCTNVTLTATPDSGYYFAGWSGGGCSGLGTCTPTLTGDQVIIATFVPAVDSLTESFTSTCGTTPPSGWTAPNNMSGHAAWTFNDPGARTNLTGGSGCFAIADSVYAGMNGVDTELRTPVKNFTGATIISLAFKTYVRRNGTSNPFFADVDVSVNGAAGPWINVWRRTEQVASGQATVSLDISAIAANQSNVMVRFHYYSNLYPYYWAVDDVSLYGVDTQAPDTTITAQPSNPSNSGSGSFSFTSTEAPGLFECSLDGAAYAGCTTPYNFSGLAAGSHTFNVRAKDASGNIDPTPASYTWTIKADTSTGVVSSLNPSNYGQTVMFTATVTPASATGTVSFLDGATPLGSAPLSAGSASISTAALSAASHSITAVYAGNGSYNGSTSSALTQVVHAPIDAVCGSAIHDIFTTTPSSNLCDPGNATDMTPTATGWSWTCSGLYNGNPASCSAKIRTYRISPFAGTGGSIAPATQQTINHGDATSFNITPAGSNTIATVSGCSGTLTGTTFTTAAITGNCDLVVVFSSGGTKLPVVQVPQTGQSGCWNAAGQPVACAGSGQDAATSFGAPLPATRFIDNHNGTLTDNLTGLVWLQNANCFTPQTWTEAVASISTLASTACGLTDSSAAGAWRLPNRKELLSLTNWQAPVKSDWLNSQGFSGAQGGNYWTSSTLPNDNTNAYYLDLNLGGVGGADKGSLYRILGVRNGN